MKKYFIRLALAFIAGALIAYLLIASNCLHIWEDGSWAIGNFPYILKGCLPLGLCNL